MTVTTTALGLFAVVVATAPTASAYTSTPAGASSQAQLTGVPVEVTSDTTETSQVMAQPDGGFVLTSTLTPARTMQNGSWVPIDTTLKANADGTYSPVATTEQMRFSGGGSGPLVQVSDGARSVSFSWQSPLPQPTINGDTATYASVLPGVDLQLIARSDEYSSVLVVHDAKAAANPALAKLQFKATASGVALSKASDGTLHATDAGGNDVFLGAPPIMWDSSSSPQAGPVPTSDDPGGGKMSAVGLAMATANGVAGPPAATTLTLTPPSSALTGSNVVYPVYIDPSITKARWHFAVVFNNGWHYYDDTSNDLKVGDCAWPGCNGIGIGRTYLSFNTTALTNQPTTADVHSADVQLYENHAAAPCGNPTTVDLFASSAGIGPNTAWPGPITGTALDKETTAKGDTCPPAGVVHFNSSGGTNTVQGYFQTEANNDVGTTTVAIRADNEGDPNGWRRFDSVGNVDVSNSAKLVVNFTFPPQTPNNLSISSSVDCRSQGQPTVYVRDQHPTLHATAHDVNWNIGQPWSVGFAFHVWTNTGTNDSEAVTNDPTYVNFNPDGNGDANANWATNMSGYTNNPAKLDDGPYRFRVRAYSNLWDKPEAPLPSDWYYFTIDHQVPSAPTITSFDYPPSDWGQSANYTLGKIHFSATDAGPSGMAGFSYAIDSNIVPSVSDSDCSYTGSSQIPASSGGATLTLPSNLSVGQHTISVKAFDNAHNMGAATTYTFDVAPIVDPNEGSTRYEAETLATNTSTPLTQPAGQNDNVYVDTNAPASWMWSHDQQEHLVPTIPSGQQPPTYTDPTTWHRYTFSFTAPLSSQYEIGVHPIRGPQYGNIAFEVDGQPTYDASGNRVQYDAWSSSALVSSGYVPLGTTATGENYFQAGDIHTITIDVTSKDPNSTGYDAGIDAFTIVPITYPEYPNITAAMNNQGLTDGTVAANFEPSAQHAGISLADMHAANMRQGDTLSINGGATQFLMPSYRTSSSGTDIADNVLSDGQFIHVGVPASQSVNLVVGSTCGAVTSSPSIQANITFDDGTQHPPYINSQLPTIPSWTDQSPTLTNVVDPITGQATATIGSATSTQLRRYIGTALDQTNTPAHLYVVRLLIPAQYTGLPVKTIELPYIQGSNFSDSGCATSPKLHVFAISTTAA